MRKNNIFLLRRRRIGDGCVAAATSYLLFYLLHKNHLRARGIIVLRWHDVRVI